MQGPAQPQEDGDSRLDWPPRRPPLPGAQEGTSSEAGFPRVRGKSQGPKTSPDEAWHLRIRDKGQKE